MCGIQSTKSYIAVDLAFFFSICDVNTFNDRINILEYPEFVVSRRDFRFKDRNFLFGSFKYIGNFLRQRLR